MTLRRWLNLLPGVEPGKHVRLPWTSAGARRLCLPPRSAEQSTAAIYSAALVVNKKVKRELRARENV